MKYVTLWPLYVLALGVIGCHNGTPEVNGTEELNIRLASEPDRLNPMLSRQATATEVERFLFAPLEDYDPVSLTLQPVLLKQRAKVTPITSGPYAGGLAYEMEILAEASWDDGSPVTGHDYLFTMKAALNPFVENASWRSYISRIADIEVDEVNPKRVTAWMAKPYILGEEVICQFNVYPEYIYDSAKVMRSVSFRELKEFKHPPDSEVGQNLQDWAKMFNSDRFSRIVVSGCGPYEFVEWQSGRQLLLKRKENHWSGEVRNPHALLQAIPERLNYYFIPETQTAITSLKDGRLDVLSDLSSEQYLALETYNQTTHTLDIKQAPILQYFYICYNNQGEILADRNVRQAISHLLDMDEIIDKLFSGLGSRTIGPIHPSKSYYHQSLPPIPYDPQKAQDLLRQSGWQKGPDSEFLTQPVEKIPRSLSIDLLTSRRRLSQDIGIILKENAALIGININIVPLEFKVLMTRVRAGDYQLAALASTQSPGLNDPYDNWHSDNAGGVGSNHSRFRHAECDQIIEDIRIELDESVRNDLYLRFQEIIYQEQPALFLVAPRKVIAHSNRISLQPSAMRPGYFANLATSK